MTSVCRKCHIYQEAYFLFFVFNYYICRICCNFSLCNIFLFIYCFVCVCVWVCVCECIINLSFRFLGLRKCAQILLYLMSTLLLLIFKFILAYQLLGGIFLVSPDLNKRSKRFTPALQMVCALFNSVTCSSSIADGWLERNWRFWCNPFLIFPNAPNITGTVNVLTFHMLLTSIFSSLYLFNFSASFC